MEPKEQRAARHIMTSASFYVAVSKAVFVRGLDAGDCEDEQKPSYDKSCRLIGKIKPRWDCRQIENLSCEVVFSIDDLAKYQIQNDLEDPIVGSATYVKLTEGDSLSVNIVCTSEYFGWIEEIAKTMTSSEVGELWLSVGILGFPKDWKPAEPGPGEISFWVTSAELQWRAEVGQQNTS